MRLVPRAREAGLVTLGLILAGCSTVLVTPAAMRAADVPPEARAHAVATLHDAFARCNEFMASPFRHTLPPGTFVLDDARGLSFNSPSGIWPLEIRVTGWGDFFTSLGLCAQEGEGGFTVGSAQPDRDPLVDNTLLRDLNGFEMSPDTVADLILHETTHVVCDEGAIGFWKSAAYYLEAIFCLRVARTHSDEHRAYSTGEEYHAFIQAVGADERLQAWLLAELEKHIATADDDCRHAPPDPLPRSPAP
jgi:hypothetical protein